MTKYRTKDGDTVDAICWKYYGRTEDTTEAVYMANVGLADKGPILQAGIIITLPEIAAPEKDKGVSLWD
ncbi:MAG: tail protein X [Desulfovibrio sp.]